MTSRPNDDQLPGVQTHGVTSAHDEWDELAVGYALTALEPDEMERFIEHLVAFCPQCQQSVDDTVSVGAELATALPVPFPPPSDALRSAVLSAAFAVRPAVPQTSADLDRVAPVTALTRRAEPATATGVAPATAPDSTGSTNTGSTNTVPPAGDAALGRGSGSSRVSDLAERRERRVARSAGWLVAAAAAVVAVVMSVTAVMAMHSRDRTAAAEAGYRSAVAAVVANSGQVVPLKDNAGTDVASVVAHAASVSVVSLDMVPNSASTSYVLWGINGKTKNPIALGVFDVTGAKVQTRQVGTDSRGYSGFTSFAVSHESGHTPPATPTTIVAEGVR